MRLGVKPIGSWIPGAPQAVPVVLTPAQYAALLASDPTAAAAVRAPFQGGEYAATVAMYPALAGTAIEETSVARDGTGAYRISLDGYGLLPYWRNATWTQKANEPDKLTFEYPADADNATNLVRPGKVRLYDATGQFVQVFRLVDLLPSVRRDDGGTWVSVKAEGLLGSLADEWVSYHGPIRLRPRTIVADYIAWREAESRTEAQMIFQLIPAFANLAAWSAGYTMTETVHTAFKALIATFSLLDPFEGDNIMDALAAEIVNQAHADTIPNHIAALMAEFQISGDIAIGPFYDPLDGDTITPTFEACSLLECLTELHKLSGQRGSYTVTPANSLVWLPSLGGDGGAVSVGYNLRSLERHCDTSEVATVLTVYGQGLSADSRLQATATANTGTYGVIPRQVWVDTATTQADLNAYAAALVSVLSVPVVDYSVSAADLYSVGMGGHITLGSTVNVTDTDLGIATQQTIVGITRKLDNVLDVTVQFAKHKRDMPAIIKALQDRISRLERRDDSARIAQAIRDGRLPIVRDGAHIDGAPRQTDLRVADRLQYHDGQDWRTLPVHDPDSPQPGDSRINDTTGELEHYDGANWEDTPTHEPLGDPRPGDSRINDTTGELEHYNGSAWIGPGDETEPIGLENDAGTLDNYARADHVHLGVPMLLEEVSAPTDMPTTSVPSSACILFTTSAGGVPYIMHAALWDSDAAAAVWQRISHLDEEPVA